MRIRIVCLVFAVVGVLVTSVNYYNQMKF